METTLDWWPHHYVLIDPRIDDPIKSVFYVGRASGGKQTPEKRFAYHLYEARTERRSYKCNKIKSIWKSGLEPVLIELPDCSGDNELEMSLIASYMENGAVLTNATYGGEGCLATPEVKAKISAAQLVACARPETKARKAAHYSKPETKAKLSIIRRKSLSNLETRTKLSVALRAAHVRPGEKEKRSIALRNAYYRMNCQTKAERNRKISEAHSQPEVRIRKSIALKSAFASEECRTARSSQRSKEWKSPEIRKKRSDGIKQAFSNPETKNRLSESHRISHARPEVREKILAANRASNSRPEVRMKISESLKTRNALLRSADSRYASVCSLYAQGLQITEIVRQTGMKRRLIYSWINYYKRDTNECGTASKTLLDSL